MRENVALFSEENHLNYDDTSRLQDSCKPIQKNIDMLYYVKHADFQARNILRDKGHFIMVKWAKSIGIYRNIKFGST